MELGEDMIPVVLCESGFNQFDRNGRPLQSPTRDFGLTQINEKTWDGLAKHLLLDYKHDVDDNIMMAKIVIMAQGKSAWVCYRHPSD